MSGYDDDDDWVGEPPEGRYTSDRAKPSFWWQSKAALFGFLGLVFLIVVLLVVVLL